MPGDDRRKIEKGAALGVDSVIMDLEDGVALNNKAAARETVTAALREVDFGTTERLVRINPVGGAFYQDDLDATIDGHPDGYVLPKVDSAQMVGRVADWLTAAEHAHGWGAGEIALHALIESGLGVVRVREIAGSSDRLAGLIFGAEDLAGDLGATRTPEGLEVLYARSAVVLHAKTFGRQAIDSPFVQLHDEPGLVAETQRAMQMGYTGKLAIHPRQVEIIQGVFTPTTDELAHAQALVAEHARQQAAGTGVFTVDGKMIDMPMIRAAETVIARARAAGLIDDAV
jgi:citrate lyase beta subunit